MYKICSRKQRKLFKLKENKGKKTQYKLTVDKLKIASKKIKRIMKTSIKSD